MPLPIFIDLRFEKFHFIGLLLKRFVLQQQDIGIGKVYRRQQRQHLVTLKRLPFQD